MTDPDDLFRGPNDGAYECQEARTGPPLDYVAEKLRRNLEHLHCAINRPPTDNRGVQDCRAAFQYGLVSFLALHNLLAIANEVSLGDRLAGYSHDDFCAWLDRIQQEGSVTG